MLPLTVNGRAVELAQSPQTPLLWVLRDAMGLKGTKYACGGGVCGSCTVLVEGEAVRACVTPLGEVAGKRVTTIEGLASHRDHPVLRAWAGAQVPQCGYCQPGLILSVAALLAENPSPSDDEIDAALSGVLCRCGTYQRVRRAIHLAAEPEKLPPAAEAAGTSGAGSGSGGETPFRLNPWVAVDRKGLVTVVIDRSEMGQQVETALAMLVAEELEVDFSRVRTEFAPADPVYVNPALGRQATGGSTSVRAAWVPLRRAGASAREMLIAAAAGLWGVEAKECRAERGAVLHPGSGRRLGYGALAEKAADMPPPADVPLKPPEAFRLIGTSPPQLAIFSHMEGRTLFGCDVALPGMLVATVARCPAFGGRVASFDDGEARKVAGVREVLEIEAGVAVVADGFWPAQQGREALRITWDAGPNAGLSSAEIRRRFQAAAQRPGEVARAEGDVDAALAGAARVIEAVYETPYVAHATMEPMNCTARVSKGRCDVWVPTQAQTGAREAAAEAAGLPLAAVQVHSTHLGGGFGRRLQQDFVREAVEVAKAVGAPVQVMWTREDDMRHDFYRPASLTLLKGGIDGEGRPLAWFQRIAGPALAFDGVDLPYAIPAIREEHVEEDPGIPTGPWRSVGASQNAFVIEGFIDELAALAGRDPLDYRLDLLAGAPRHRTVLELAADKAGWGRPLAEGRHRGLAVYCSFGSWVAQVAELSVSGKGEVKLHRVVCAFDCGTPVNPDGIRAQVEGAVAFGLTAALKGEITILNGAVEQGNFRDYPLLTIAEMPEVEVHILPSPAAYGGVGEPAVPPIAPAVANALYAATGVRLRRLPIRAADLRGGVSAAGAEG